MKRTLLLISACVMFSACHPRATRIEDVSDLPVKSTKVPSRKWENSPLRSHALHVFYDARTASEQEKCLGDYFYVNWYDADPTRPAKLVMHYTQARTTRTVLTSTIDYPEARKSTGTHRECFRFNGPERAQNGDILSWRIELYVDGKLVDSRQSYLWE